MRGALLDTCAALWLTFGAEMKSQALDAMADAAADRCLWVSPVTGWEAAAKISAGKPGAPLLKTSPAEWYANILALPGVREAPLNGAMALRSAQLPWLHRDPADRFLIATAAELEVILITRDRVVLDYAEAGLVNALAC